MSSDYKTLWYTLNKEELGALLSVLSDFLAYNKDSKLTDILSKVYIKMEARGCAEFLGGFNPPILSTSNSRLDFENRIRLQRSVPELLSFLVSAITKGRVFQAEFEHVWSKEHTCSITDSFRNLRLNLETNPWLTPHEAGRELERCKALSLDVQVKFVESNYEELASAERCLKLLFDSYPSEEDRLEASMRGLAR